MVERRERKRVKRGKKEMVFLVGFSMEKIERRRNGGVESGTLESGEWAYKRKRKRRERRKRFSNQLTRFQCLRCVFRLEK